MGADIHLYAERLVDDKWESADTWTEDKEEPSQGNYVDYKNAIYSGRNYDLFGLLAGVRRDFGERSLEPKGLPSDVSEEVNAMSESWDIDGHSHSHLDMQELKEQMMLNTIDPVTEDMFKPLQTILNGLKDLGGDDQRIVFWFDS